MLQDTLLAGLHTAVSSRWTLAGGPPPGSSRRQQLLAHCFSNSMVVVAAGSMRRSPATHSKLVSPRHMNGTGHQAVYVQHAAARPSCVRCLRCVLPILLASLLSSYVTYWIVYSNSRHALLHSRTGLLLSVEQQHHLKQQQVLDLATLKTQRADADAAAKAADTSSGAQSSAAQVDASQAAAAVATAAQQGGAAVAAALGGPSASKTEARPASLSKEEGPAKAADAPAAHAPTGSRDGAHPPFATMDAAFKWVKATGRRMTVALVNHAPYHLEIVAGFLHICNQLPLDVTWYQVGQQTPDGRLTATQLVEMQVRLSCNAAGKLE